MTTEAREKAIWAARRALREGDGDLERVVDGVLAVAVRALEAGFHPQNPTAMHPADYVKRVFRLHGWEGLCDVREAQPMDSASDEKHKGTESRP